MSLVIRKHSNNNLPYQVNDSITKRFDICKALNPMVMATRGYTALTRVQKVGRGFSRLGLAWVSARLIQFYVMDADR